MTGDAEGGKAKGTVTKTGQSKRAKVGETAKRKVISGKSQEKNYIGRKAQSVSRK